MHTGWCFGLSHVKVSLFVIYSQRAKGQLVCTYWLKNQSIGVPYGALHAIIGTFAGPLSGENFDCFPNLGQ